jgi:hypothetical protein
MANFVVSYDLNGPVPTHKEMDQHLFAVAGHYGRLLETVWYVSYEGSARQLREYVDQLLGSEDRVLVVEVLAASWRNILVPGDQLIATLEVHK